MKQWLRFFQPITTHWERRQRYPKFIRFRLLLLLLLLSGVLILTLGIGTPLVVAQSDRGVKQEEDKLIREYVPLPSAPSQPPVYKPIPEAPPQQESAPPPKRESAPPPERQAEPAPAPRQRENPAPEPESQSAPPRSRTPEPAPEPAARPEPRETVPDSTSDRPPAKRPSAGTSDSSSDRTSDTDSVTETLKGSQRYAVEFNRSPVVGNRFRLRGVYSEARLGFTRPRGWKVTSAKALIRYQHSPALLASRSNLTVQVNSTSIGSVPLNRKASQAGQASQVGQILFPIPPKLLQDYNDLSIVAQQNNNEKCSDPSDPTLWTEVLPDSKILFEYQPSSIPLNFSRYPYPFFDDLALETNRIVYLVPKVNQAWLTAAPRLQAALGRLAKFRPIETRLVQSLDEVKANDHLVIIGTPADQPALKSLDLPFKISTNKLLDGDKNPLDENKGLLMLTTAKKGSIPVLVVTGNATEGVINAAQFLVQPDTSQLRTGPAIVVNEVKPAATPSSRNWPLYLPEQDSFKLSDLRINDKPFTDITVRGSSAPPIEFDFRALPDDQFLRGSSMNLVYSYGPQVNPRLSAVEVLLNDDNVFVGGARLTNENGATRQTLKVDLPANLIKPNSKIKVAFRLNPLEPPECGKVVDQQLTGTVHANTEFKLKREKSVQLPDLELLRTGFPFAAPQDLSSTAMVVPDAPSKTDLLTLLAVSERLGRLSRAQSVQLKGYTTSSLPAEVSKSHHLVGIGTRAKFPFPKALEAGGFRLNEAFSRQTDRGNIQALGDRSGVIKEVLSPDNSDRVVLALSAQTEDGLERVRQIINQDPWFFQLREDTVLVSSDATNLAAYEPDAYTLEFLERAPAKKRQADTNLLSNISHFLQEHWFLLPAGIVAIALLLYGIGQIYLNRVTDKKSH